MSNDQTNLFEDLESDLDNVKVKGGNSKYTKEPYRETCLKCGGSGLYRLPSSLGHNQCLKCKGKGYLEFMTSRAQREANRQKAYQRKIRKQQEKAERFARENPVIYKFLQENEHWSDFFKSLLADGLYYGNLTDKQEKAVLNAMDKLERKRQQKEQQTTAVDLSRIHQLIDNAKSKGLKFPKLIFDGVCIKPAGANSKNAGALYITESTAFQSAYYGKVQEGKFYPSTRCPEWVAEFLQRIAADPDTEFRNYGKRTGQCCCCGRTLTNSNSIAEGIGPICAGKFGV